MLYNAALPLQNEELQFVAIPFPTHRFRLLWTAVNELQKVSRVIFFFRNGNRVH